MYGKLTIILPVLTGRTHFQSHTREPLFGQQGSRASTDDLNCLYVCFLRSKQWHVYATEELRRYSSIDRRIKELRVSPVLHICTMS